MFLSGIYIYPIKSLGGFEVAEATITNRGLKHDRRWMVVDEHNRFITQRTHAEMALIKTSIEHDQLILHHGENRMIIPLDPEDGNPCLVKVWEDECDAVIPTLDVHAWLSDIVHRHVRLAYMPDASKRGVDVRYAPEQTLQAFTDGYPFLLIGSASLNDLNSKLSEPVRMDRFRPNFVVQTGEAFEEDGWKKIRIGSANFRGVKRCSRCVMTTIDQQTAAKSNEPLRTLASYRTENNKVYFGQNLIFSDGAHLVVRGDAVSAEF